MDEILAESIVIFKIRRREAYSNYTGRTIFLLDELNNKEIDFNSFDYYMKRTRARLSQAVGAASKAGKQFIIYDTASRLSKEKLNLSLREAIELLKVGAGRAINKRYLSGLYWREKTEENYFSPYFKDPLYREKMNNHTLIIELKTKCDKYEEIKNDLLALEKNPFQELLKIHTPNHKKHQRLLQQLKEIRQKREEMRQ